jgi:hypothetical protein
MKTEIVEPNKDMMMNTEMVGLVTNLNAGSRSSNIPSGNSATSDENVVGRVVLKVRFRLVRNHQRESQCFLTEFGATSGKRSIINGRGPYYK